MHEADREANISLRDRCNISSEHCALAYVLSASVRPTLRIRRHSTVRRAASTAILLLLLVAACTSTAPRQGLRVAVVSDLNSRYGSTDYEPEVSRVVALIVNQWKPDLVLSAGDLIAGQKPELSDDEVRAMWAAFDSVVAAPLRQADIPFGFTLGNHDGSAYPAHRRDREMAIAHWRKREHHPGVTFVDSTNYPVYYSFTEGDVFVLVWDASYAGTVEDSTMMDWLRRELHTDRARAARYRLALGHLPLYGVAEGRNRRGEVLHEGDSLRRLLEDHHIDTYVSGHHHAYYPGRRGGIDLLHSGALGQGPRPLIGSDAPPSQSVTLLDFHFESDSVAYTTYRLGDEEMTIVETAELPPIIRGFNGYVIRRDLPDSAVLSADTSRADELRRTE